MQQYTHGYITRLHPLNMVSLYLTACYLKEYYGYQVLTGACFSLLTARLSENFDFIQEHPHAFLITQENLKSNDTSFIMESKVPVRIGFAAKQLLETSRQGKLYERSA